MQPATPAAPDSLRHFALGVLSRAAGIPDGPLRAGRKVFLAAVVDDAQNVDTQRQLVEAHRAGLLELHRCDMTPAYDASIQARSRVTYMHAEWHYVAAPSARESHVRLTPAFPAWPGLEFAVRLARAMGTSEYAVRACVTRHRHTKGADAWTARTWGSLILAEASAEVQP